MSKKLALLVLGAIALIAAPEGQKAFAQAAAAPRPAGLPDDFKLNLMIRATIIALNQANATGNYSVLRDLGTPNFQITNSTAKLAEVFAPLRARKLDLSPILFYNPKLVSPPAIQEGQVLRMTGFVPTAPEQVNFDLAFQMFADQWMLAGIALSTSPSQESQRAQTSSLQSPPARSEGAAPAAGEAKPIRIDLSDPAALPPKKPKKAKPANPPKDAAQAPAQQHNAQAPDQQSAEPVDEKSDQQKTSGVLQNWQPAR